MIKSIIKVATTVIMAIAFVMLFAEAETLGAQILCTSVSLIILYAGYKILDRMGTFDTTI